MTVSSRLVSLAKPLLLLTLATGLQVANHAAGAAPKRNVLIITVDDMSAEITRLASAARMTFGVVVAVTLASLGAALVIAFVLFQRHFIGGITAGAVKQ